MRLFTLILLALFANAVIAQINDNDGNLLNNGMERTSDGDNRYSWGRDSTHKQKTDVPEGFTQWTIDERLGERISQDNDTVMAGFYRVNANDGMTGQYIHLANVGSPRLSRVFFDRPLATDAYFIQGQYGFARPTLSTFRFWNTKSPHTNLSYHSVGGSELGEDHLKAIFSVNINKRAGVGFLIDYVYGRGYYANQGNSIFNGSLYGYYLGDKYSMHAWFSANHIKTSENGGIENDDYITNPESFDRDFTSAEIPTRLTSNWNRNDDQTYYLSHRYNMGYYRDVELPDSINVDSLLANDSTYVVPQEFVPVASVIHTFQLRHLRHTHIAYKEPENYYTDNFYGTLGSVEDDQYNTNIRNTLGLSLREGFKKWVKAGFTAFITHDYNQYHIPAMPAEEGQHPLTKFVEHDVSVGGTFARTGGKALKFNVTGDINVIGANVGNFNIDGKLSLSFPLFKDTCNLDIKAYIKNNKPSFFLRKWHSQHAWWEEDLNKEFRTRVEGVFNIRRTRTTLRVGWENVTNYTYIGTTLTPVSSKESSRAFSINQCGSSIQILSATLNQNFALGILHWDNEVTWQRSSNERVLDLPTISLFTNLYIHFRIAKILRIDLGANMRFWTKFYAPDYAPALNQYTVQDADNRIKVGNHPVIDVYVNAQMKRIRFYVSANHVNAGSHPGFYLPHYPINPMNIHFGLSWNFIN
mgnify:CR=1 FL=1